MLIALIDDALNSHTQTTVTTNHVSLAQETLKTLRETMYIAFGCMKVVSQHIVSVPKDKFVQLAQARRFGSHLRVIRMRRQVYELTGCHHGTEILRRRRPQVP
jgi:hypothetical protein